MKLLIISDLHFDEKNDWNFIDNITKNMIHRLKNKTIENEEIIVIVLGDIINRGSVGNIDIKFSEADKFIENLQNSLINVKFLFLPGNHEILKNSFELTSFNEFCQRHSYKKEFVFTMDESVFSIEESELNLILVDSTLTRNHDLDGKIDIKSLKAKMGSKKNIIFMHHPPCPQDGADRSVKNSTELIATHSNFIFYGHQHGAVKIPDFLEHDTDIHSVGALFKQEVGCSNEFLLLDIVEGRINFAYRYFWAATKFVAHLLFPAKVNILSDHLAIGNPDNTNMRLIRKVKRIINTNDNTDYEHSLWNDYIGEDIDVVVAKQNLVLLVGDAGIGKSFELANVYWHYENHEDLFPIWINLRNTNFSDVVKCIGYAQYNTVDRKIPLLIMDGLDEMDGSSIIDLIKELGSAINGNPEVKIILSTRTNFKVSIDNKFVQYHILPLTNKQINTVASENGIFDTAHFLKCLNSTDCLSLARSPFYLFDIVRIYRGTRSLPERSLLLNQMISFRFMKGDERHPCAYKETLMANEWELRYSLKELSFLMQSLHKYALDNELFTQVFSSQIRDFFNRSGLITSKQDEYTLSWEFEHNVFREFLVADYLSEIPFEELLCIIAFDEDQRKLRPSWVNIVSFLLPMRKDDALIHWLIENASDAIYQFESDRIKTEERDKIFVRLMRDSVMKRVPIYALHPEEKLAKYFQSELTICFLLEFIKEPINEYAILSVLSILRYFDNFYGKESQIKDAIMPYLRDTLPSYIVSMGLKALSHIFSVDLTPVITELFALVKNDERAEVIGALCKLINQANVSDEYSEYIFGLFDKFTQIQENYSVWKEFSEAFTSFQEPENLLISIEFLCSNRSHHFHKSDELFGELIHKIFESYKNGHQYLINSLVDIFALTSRKCDRRKSKLIKQLFCDYGILSEAFQKLLKLKMPIDAMMFSIEDLMEESLADILVSSYMNNEVDPEAYKWYARRLTKDSSIYKKLSQSVLEKEGVAIKIEEVKDWEKIRREGKQRYFNSLFDKTQFSTLIDELVAFLGYDITCEQLLGDSFSKVPNDREDMLNILTALFHSGNEDWQVINFLDRINWDDFCISEVCRIVRNREQVELSSAQEHFIQAYFDKTIADINFEELGETQFFIAERIVLLSNALKFDISDEKLLEMLMLPWYVFVSSTSTGESETLKFVTERIVDVKKLQDKILENIRNRKLAPLAAQTHLLYCLENDLPNAIEMAIDLFNSELNEAKYHKNTAVDYLLAIKGNKFVDDLVSKVTDYDLLVYLAHCMKRDNTNLINKLVDENKKAAPRTLFLRELLELNNRYALETYLEMATKANGLPDLHSEDSRIEEITMAVRKINDISLIDVISKLFEVCYSEEFTDKESFGLRGALDTVINNLIQVDKFRLKKMLTELIDKHPENGKLFSICHWHLNHIDRLINVSSDSPWDIEATLDFLKSYRTERYTK